MLVIAMPYQVLKSVDAFGDFRHFQPLEAVAACH